MAIDILLLITFLFAIYKGWTRGLILGIFSLLALVIGLAAALKLSAEAGLYLEQKTGQPGKFWPAVAFILIFVLIAFMVRLIAALLKKVLSAIMLGWLNRLAGIVFYLLTYTIIFSVLLWLADQLHLIPDSLESGSFSYERIRFLGPRAVDTFTGWMPWFKDVFKQMEAFFGKVSPFDQATF